MVSCQRNQDPATNTLSEMCERLFPQHAHSFQFQLLTDSVDIDRFTLESDNGKILIKGNNRNSLAVGLNHYLKYYCQAHVSWYASDSVVMPAQLPEVEAPVIYVQSVRIVSFLIIAPLATLCPTGNGVIGNDLLTGWL